MKNLLNCCIRNLNLPQKNTKKQRLQEQGIHLERLIYLTKEEFLFFKRLRDNFLKRAASFSKKVFRVEEGSSEKPEEQRSKKKAGNNKGFGYENSGTWQGRETLRWQWIRAYEYDKELRFEQRYERQGKVAEKIMRNVGYNKIINY